MLARKNDLLGHLLEHLLGRLLCQRESLGIASAGATGLKEPVHVLQATMRACSFWNFTTPFGQNRSTVFGPFSGSNASPEKRKEKDIVRYLGDPPPTVLSPLWG